MIEIRIHGRGGQGAVIASKLLAQSFFKEGKYIQAFPTYGVERRGAPVAAFVRVDDKPVLIRSQIYQPDHIVVLDPSLLEAVDVTSGLKEGGWVLINTVRDPDDFKDLQKYRVATVDASGIAVKYSLGSKSHPIVNTAILGAFAKVTGFVSIDSIVEAIKESVPLMPENNAKAAREAYDKVRI